MGSPFPASIEDYNQNNSHNSVSTSSSAVATLDRGRLIIIRASPISQVWVAGMFSKQHGEVVPANA